MDHKVTKGSKEMQELKDPQDHLDDQVLQEVLEDQEPRVNGATRDFPGPLVVMDSLEELAYRVLLVQSANLDRMELKEMLDLLVKKDLRDQKAL